MVSILELLQDKRANKNYEVLNQANQACKALHNPLLRFAYEKLLTRLYQEENEYEESGYKMLELCSRMKQELQEQQELDQRKELVFIYECEILAWNKVAIQAQKHCLYEQSKQAYAKSIDLFYHHVNHVRCRCDQGFRWMKEWFDENFSRS